MTFYLIGGIVSVILSIILIVIFLITHKMDERSIVPKIIMWVGMLASVAGAAFLTIEYSFPNVSHPKAPHVPTVYERFVEYYGDLYYSFIKENTEHLVVDEFISVEHKQLNTLEEESYSITMFKTEVIYDVDSDLYIIIFLNKYEYTKDYSYQNVVSYALC